MKPHRHSFPNLIAFGGLALLVSGASLHALDATWTYDGTLVNSNRWGEPTSWSTNPDIPNAKGDTARFTANITGNRAITLDAPRTVGMLVVGDADSTHNYTLSTGTAGGALIFDPLGTASAVMQVAGTGTGATGVVTVSAPVTLNAPLRLYSNHTATATISGVISGAFGLTIDNDDGVTPVGPTPGVGLFSLGNVNIFTGGVTVDDVRVAITNSAALGSGPVTVQDGGGVWINGALTVANDFHLTGTGWPETLGAVGAIRLNNNANINGNIALAGASGDSNGTAPDASIFPLTTSTANIGATINGVVSGGDLLVGSMTTDTGATTATGNEILNLANANTYGDSIVRPLDAPTSGQTMLSVGNTTSNTTATLGTGKVYLVGGAGGKLASLRFWRGGGYTLQQDIISSGNAANTALLVDVIDGGLTLNGKSVTVGQQVRLGSNANGSTLNIDAGTQLTAGQIFTGNAASNSTTVNQTGGTVTVSGEVRIAHWPTETSAWNMEDGFLTLTGIPTANPFITAAPFTEDATGKGTLYIGVDGQGLFNQTGGEVTAAAVVLDGRSNSGAGTNMPTGIDQYLLAGGFLNLGSVVEGGNWGIQGNSTSQFVFGGGTLNAGTSLPISVPMAVEGAASTLQTNGHTVALGAAITGSGTLHLADSSPGQSGKIVLNPAADSTISAAIAGALPIEKSGAALLTLASSNPASGPLSLTGGGLRLAGSYAGDVAVASATLWSGGAIGGGLLFAADTTNTLAYAGAPLTVAGTITIGAGSTNLVNLAPLPPPAPGTYPLLTGSAPIDPAAFQIDPVAAASFRQTFGLAAAGNTLNLTVSGSNLDLTWRGNGSGDADWDIATSANWANAEKFYAADAVTFDDTALSVASVPALLTTNIAGGDNDLVFTAKAAGAAGAAVSVRYVKPADPDQPLAVSVSGSAITVSLATDMFGDADTTSGEIKAAIEAHGPASALVTVAHADPDEGLGFVAAMPEMFLTFGTAELVVIPENVVVSPSGMVFANNGLDYGISAPGAIGGSGGLLKSGRGKLSISSSNSFTGDTVIAKGEVFANATNALGTGAIFFGDATTGLGDVCTLTLGTGPLALANPAITVAATCLHARIFSTGGTLAATSLTMMSPGKLSIGQLSVDPAQDYKTNVSYLTGAPDILVEKGTLAFTSINVPGTGANITLGGAASGADDTIIEVPKAATGDQVVLNANFTLGTLGEGNTSEAIFRYVGAGPSGGAPAVSGSINLNGRDFYLENTSRTTGGQQRLWNFGAKISGTGNVRVRCGENNGTFDGGQRVRIVFNGNDWDGNLYVETGQVQISNGAASTVNCIPDTSDINMAPNTSIGLGGTETINALTGGAATDLLQSAKISPQLSTTTNTVTLRVGANDGSGVFDGDLTEGGGRLAFTKLGTGTQTLNGSHSHVGATLVSAGTLVMNGANAHSPITVSAGATLAGNMVSTATQTATGAAANSITATAAAATIAPGNSIGTMTGVNINMSAGGVLAIEVDDSAAPKNDKLVATGNLNITGATLHVTVAGTAAEPAYIIASYGTLTGAFGTVNKPSGYKVVYDYDDGESTNNIALVAVSDPYLAWLEGYGALTGASRAPGVDFDGDGLDNGVEFVIGADPTAFTPATTPGYPTAVLTGGNLVFTFRRTEDAKEYQVTVETSTDLATWPPAAAYPIPTTDGVFGAVTVAGENVTVTVPLAGANKKFARLKVEIPFEP